MEHEDYTLRDFVEDKRSELSFEVEILSMEEEELNILWNKLFEERRILEVEYNKVPNDGMNIEGSRKDDILIEYKLITNRMKIVEHKLSLYDSIRRRK